MSTWQLGGLNSLAPANSNAMSPQVQQPMQYQPRPNLGVQLAGAASQLLGNYKQQQYQQAFGQALASGNVDQMKQLYASNPQFFQQTQQGLGLINSDRQQEVGNAAMDISMAMQTGDPQAVQAMMQKHAGTLKSFGTNPNDAYQHWQQNPQQSNQIIDLMGMHASGVKEYYDQQFKRAQLAQTGNIDQQKVDVSKQNADQQGIYQSGEIQQGWGKLGIAQQNADTNAYKAQVGSQNAQQKSIQAQQDYVNAYDARRNNVANALQNVSAIMGTSVGPDGKPDASNINPDAFDSLFGKRGAFNPTIPGSDAANARAQLNQLQGVARQIALSSAKGRGGTSNSEMESVANAVLNIDGSTSATAARAAISRFNSVVQREAASLKSQQPLIDTYRNNIGQYVATRGVQQRAPVQQIQAGHTEGGYTYLGGDPRNPNSWRAN